jgi:hypothetical protein
MGTGGCTSSSNFAFRTLSTTLTVSHFPSTHSYYTAGTNGTFDNQFTHVLKGGQDPLDAYEYEGMKLDPSFRYRVLVGLTM